MTIAMCYVSPEGVVLGADSTATFSEPGLHFYNHNQKIYEIGTNGTLGIVTWGLGGLGGSSHRTLAAQLAYGFEANPPADVLEVAKRWVDLFQPLYDADPSMVRYRDLGTKAAHNPSQPTPNQRTQPEEKLFTALATALPVGFCIAGRVGASLTPAAYELAFRPLQGAPVPDQIEFGKYRFWGIPDVIQRLYKGFDKGLPDAILQSGKWGGTAAELDTLLSRFRVEHPTIPIRDAVDFVHSSIYITIKTLKFSAGAQVCGGPIEIAVITTDRAFRWVRHKPWDAAITEGDCYDR